MCGQHRVNYVSYAVIAGAHVATHIISKSIESKNTWGMLFGKRDFEVMTRMGRKIDNFMSHGRLYMDYVGSFLKGY